MVDEMVSLCCAGWSWGWGWGRGRGRGRGWGWVVRWRVANELVDEELLVGSVLSKVVELLFEVFCELLA